MKMIFSRNLHSLTLFIPFYSRTTFPQAKNPPFPFPLPPFMSPFPLPLTPLILSQFVDLHLLPSYNYSLTPTNPHFLSLL